MLVARLRDRHSEIKMTIDKTKILKINRHLFDKGTSKKQGIAVLSPKRFDSSFALDAMCGYTPACHAEKEKVKNRVEILKLNLSLQNNGYRLDNLTKLKNVFPCIWCFLPFITFKLYNKNIWQFLKSNYK